MNPAAISRDRMVLAHLGQQPMIITAMAAEARRVASIVGARLGRRLPGRGHGNRSSPGLSWLASWGHLHDTFTQV